MKHMVRKGNRIRVIKAKLEIARLKKIKPNAKLFTYLESYNKNINLQ